jgi:hypothetical protein
VRWKVGRGKKAKSEKLKAESGGKKLKAEMLKTEINSSLLDSFVVQSVIKQKMGKQNAEIRVHPRPSVVKVFRSLRLFAAIRAWHNPTPGLSSGHATSPGAGYLYRSGLHRRRAVCAVALPACAVV